MRRISRIAAFCIAALPLAAPCLAKGKLDSRWLDREIVVDGEIDEWREALVYFGSVDAFVGLYNDSTSLYVCLYSQNPEVSNQLATDGLRLRIESKKSGAFVVHFPRGERRDPGSERRPDGDRTPAATDVVELTLPGRRDPVAVAPRGEAGLEARVSHRGSFAYELRLPLAPAEGSPWAPGLFPGDRFKLLIENPRIDTMLDEASAHDRRRGDTNPFGQGAAAPYGSSTNPAWSNSFPTANFAFLLKARVVLAESP